MNAYVDPLRLDHRLSGPLAGDLGESERVTVLRLAREIAEYGVEVLPQDLFSGRSGRSIAALAVEDTEGVVQLDRMLEPGTDPTILQLSEGRGFPGLLLAARRPELSVHVLELEDGRAWLWQRLCRVFSVRNLRVHTLDADEWTLAHRGRVDLLLLKGRTPLEAIECAGDWLAPDGRVVAWLPNDDLSSTRRPLFDPSGRRMVVERVEPFASEAAQPRALLLATRATA